MAQEVRGFFDLGKGLMVGDPREDEARAKEASSRAERALRAQMAAQALSMSQRGGGGYSMQGSPNGGGSETARKGHEISNPWNRPDSRPQVSGGFAGGGSLGGMSQNYQPGMARGGPTVNSTAYAFNPSQAFDGGVRPEREAILAEIEGGRQRKFAEDQVVADRQTKQYQFEHDLALKRDSMRRQGEQFDTANRTDLAKFLAQLQAQMAESDAAKKRQSRMDAATTLDPYREALSEGSALPKEAISKILFDAVSNPDAAPELGRFFNDPALRKIFEDRHNSGGWWDPADSRILSTLGLSRERQENKRMSNEMFEQLGRLGGGPQGQNSPDPRDLILRLLMSGQ